MGLLCYPLRDLSPSLLLLAELLVETGPTQTQQPFINTQVDKITDSIRMYGSCYNLMINSLVHY